MMPKPTDREMREAAMTTGRVLVGQHLGAMSEQAKVFATSLAAAMPPAFARVQVEAIFDVLIERLEEAKAEALAGMPAPVVSIELASGPGELRDTDRNASLWPGGHNHAPDAECRTTCPVGLRS